MLKSGERIDQLYSNHVQIIQSDEVFSFSIDAVLLAAFAKTGKYSTVIDLCAGNGVIGLFLHERFPKATITEVEIQPRLADMANRSIELNHATDKVSVLNIDLAETTDYIRKDSVDTVVCNPPFFENFDQSKKNPNEFLAIARHEIKTNLLAVIKTSSDLLKTKGKFFMIHRPDRLSEILNDLQAHRLAPKRIRFVYPKVGKNATMVLIEAIKDGQSNGNVVMPPLTIYNDSGEYTKEVNQLVYG